MGLLDRFKKKIPGAFSVQSPAVTETSQGPEKIKSGTDAVVTAPKASHAYRVVVRPLVTEKVAVMKSANKYAFVVARGASKMQVAAAIKELYGVEPLKINAINVQGKRIHFGKNQGRRSDFKKVIITVPKGTNITVHEGV